MFICLSSIAFAEDEVWNEREQLTGDWGGLRTSLKDKGMEPFLYQLFVETGLSDEWSLKLGRMSADTDFVNHDLYRYSLSSSINGPMRATLLENSITSFPYAVWDGRLR